MIRYALAADGRPADAAAGAEALTRALGALRRMEPLIQEAVVTVPRALVAETIDLIAVLVRDGHGRRLAELARAAAVVRKLADARILVVGDHPVGFDACNYDAQLLKSRFGIDTETTPVADFIAGMTDRYAASEHARITGQQLLV